MEQEFFEFSAEDGLGVVEGPPIPDSPRISPTEFGAAIQEDLQNDIKQKAEANKGQELPRLISIFKKPKAKPAEEIGQQDLNEQDVLEQIEEQKQAMPQFFMKDISTKNIAKIEIKKLLNKNVRLSLLLSNSSSYPLDHQSQSSDFSPSQATFVENPLDLDQLTL